MGVFKYLTCECDHTAVLQEDGRRKNTDLSLGNHLHSTVGTVSGMHLGLLGCQHAFRKERHFVLLLVNKQN